MLISEAFAGYAEDVIIFRNQSSKTEENHFIVMKQMIKHFGDIDMETLTFPMVRDWKISLEKTRAPNTVRNYIVRLRVVLNYLRLRGFNTLNPDTVPVPQRTDRVPVFISKEQVAQIIEETLKPRELNNVHKQYRSAALVSLLFASGLRVSEACSLNRDTIKADGSFTIVGKGGRARLCFIDERTQGLLAKYLSMRSDNNPALFIQEFNGLRLTVGVAQHITRVAAKRIGMDSLHPHTLRHSFATNLLQSNTNLYHISKMLGHQQLNTTAQYLHSYNFELQEIYKKHHSV